MKPRLKHTFLTNATCPKCGNKLYTSDSIEFEFLCDKCASFYYSVDIKCHESDYLSINIPITNEEFHHHYDEICYVVKTCNFDTSGVDDVNNDATVAWLVPKVDNFAFKFPERKTMRQAFGLLNILMNRVCSERK